MKRIGILFGLVLLSVCMVWAQNNSANSNSKVNNGSDNATQQSNNNNDAQTVDQSRKNAASNDQSAAEEENQKAKNATGETAELDHAMARMDDAAMDLNQLLAAPDAGIPESVYGKAKCVAIVPDMIKGGFIFGAEHGRGVASCRVGTDDHWSAPAFFVVTGGNWGAQIGVEGVDLTMLIMNQDGMNQLLSSKWKLSGNASASAGPVGRTASAETNWKFNTEILTYSRSKGLYAGATLNGAYIKADDAAMRAYYGHPQTFVTVLTGKVTDPHPHDLFNAALRKTRWEQEHQENAAAH